MNSAPAAKLFIGSKSETSVCVTCAAIRIAYGESELSTRTTVLTES